MTVPSSRPITLEIAVASVEDAQAAQSGGADRLELNAALALGGLTPSLGTFLEVRASTHCPIVAMVRPRPGGFCYSAAEFRVLQRDVDLLLEHGADGIALGVLTVDGAVDGERGRAVVRQIGDRTAVFHRAFDVTPDPFVALEQLIDLGARRVMTSGQQENALYGAPLIAELVRRAAGRIEILPAGGVNRFTVRDVLARTGCDQVHASLRGRRGDPSTAARPQVSFGGAVRLPEDRFEVTDEGAVAELAGMLRHE